jgi:hypothetical protein
MVRKIYFVLGQLERPRQNKVSCTGTTSPTNITKEGPFSSVLFESPFTSVSTVSRGHHSLVSDSFFIVHLHSRARRGGAGDIVQPLKNLRMSATPPPPPKKKRSAWINKLYSIFSKYLWLALCVFFSFLVETQILRLAWHFLYFPNHCTVGKRKKIV